MLIRPPHIEPEIFYEEVKFFGISDKLLETFIEVDMVPLKEVRLLPNTRLTAWLWLALTYPEDTTYGKVVSWLC
ncbi:unnamed protein product, partial [Didymodactylos carnosus]